ncbi:MAG TPA: hypothetical protein VHF27_10040 [Acidimicrobiales bacterium]|nr:hypothetical protein [Acidimicrobiales bacterium]
MRRLAFLLLPAVASAGLAACKEESVHVGFRPEAGASYRYEIKVQSVTTTVLGDEAPERSVDEVTLESRDTVLAAGPEEIKVEVQLRRAGSPDRTFRVRFDRGARLAGVDEVDGLPPEVLGSVGFPEFLPAASTAPPDRPLSPGEKWNIDATWNLPGAQSARLEGTGRLVKVTTAGGRKVASIKAETSVPLSATSRVGNAVVTISGTETTESTAARTLTDGAVQEASAVTRGDYRLTLSPESGGGAAAMTGTMSVEIRSQTRRLPDEVKASR